jgi:hypothetical protein
MNAKVASLALKSARERGWSSAISTRMFFFIICDLYLKFAKTRHSLTDVV